jgi:hypothetical protein
MEGTSQQAGSTCFVVPELVVGCLRKGFERIRALSHALAQAILIMLVVAKVHPFSDGNGRTARLAMTCMLSAQRLSRIIIPTVYREDYLLPLKALTHNKIAAPLIGSLSRAQRWSAAFDYSFPARSCANHSLDAMRFRKTCAATSYCSHHLGLLQPRVSHRVNRNASKSVSDRGPVGDLQAWGRLPRRSLYAVECV